MKKPAKILIIFFLAIFILQIASLLFLLLSPDISNAADEIKFTPQVEIPGYKAGTINSNSIGEYIKAIYKYAIGIVGIVAAVVMMFGGILWIMAGGNSEKISNAKSWITASLTGLVLALASYMILATINPALVNFEPITPKKPEPSEKPVSETSPAYSWECIPAGSDCLSKLGAGWITTLRVSNCMGDKTCSTGETKTCCKKN